MPEIESEFRAEVFVNLRQDTSGKKVRPWPKPSTIGRWLTKNTMLKVITEDEGTEITQHVSFGGIQIIWDNLQPVPPPDVPNTGDRIRISRDVQGAGKEGTVIGAAVFHQQWWVPVLMDDDQDPDFLKAGCIEIARRKEMKHETTE